MNATALMSTRSILRSGVYGHVIASRSLSETLMSNSPSQRTSTVSFSACTSSLRMSPGGEDPCTG